MSIVNNDMDKNNMIDDEFDASKKSRGRPKKTKTSEIKQNKVNEVKQENDDIILHLPISFSDFNKPLPKETKSLNNNKINNVFSKIKSDTSELSNEDDTSITQQHIKCDSINNYNEFSLRSEFKDPSLNATSIEFQEESTKYDDIIIDTENKEEMIILLKNKLKFQSRKMKELEAKIGQLERNNVKNCAAENNVPRKVHRVDPKLIVDYNGKAIPVDSTEIACWSCSHEFDTMPYFMPSRYDGERYYVYGCFCSFHCAARYAVSDCSDTWNQYSLLKQLYYSVYGELTNVLMAPKKEAFKKFGGPIDYNDFRKSLEAGNKEYRYILPPMASIYSSVEEGSGTGFSLAELNKRIQIKRNKPLPNSQSKLTTLFQK